MKRVAIVCGAGIVSGKEIMVLELAEGLRAGGYHVELASSLWGNGDFARRAKALGFPVHFLWLGFISPKLWLAHLYMTADQVVHWPGLLTGYRHFLRQAAPDKVIHTNWHHLLLIWPFLKPTRDLFWLHEIVPRKPGYCRIFRFLERCLQVYIPVSGAVERSLAHVGVLPNKILLIRNGLKDPVPDGVRRTRHESLRIGIIGQVGAWKGHGRLLEAFAKVTSAYPDAELHVFGRGSDEYEGQLKQKAFLLGIADKIVWRGFMTERAEIYRDLSVCVVPSLSEDPLPTVAIEAAYFGIPVIASHRGGLPEIVRNGITGYLCDPESPTDLAARLDELLRDAELRERLGVAARQRALQQFSRERFVGEFFQALK
jgi:glycosyltransferase involved in cell wall biosynthesis